MEDARKLRIRSVDNSLQKHVFLGDKEVYCTSLTLNLDVDNIPTAEIEAVVVPDVDVLASVNVNIAPKSVEDAVKIVRAELIKGGCLRNRVLARIGKALDEDYLPFITTDELAELILNKVIKGGESDADEKG